MPATSPRIRLLLIEDDAIDRQEFTRFVRDRNLPYDVTVALNLSEARRHLAATTFDIIVTDHQLPDGTAFDLFTSRENWADQIVILATGAGDEDTAAAALRVIRGAAGRAQEPAGGGAGSAMGAAATGISTTGASTAGASAAARLAEARAALSRSTWSITSKMSNTWPPNGLAGVGPV